MKYRTEYYSGVATPYCPHCGAKMAEQGGEKH